MNSFASQSHAGEAQRGPSPRGEVPASVEVLVLGGGPTGIEALLALRASGLDAHLLEARSVADSVRRWGHVRLFSPWDLNMSPLGRRTLGVVGASVPELDSCPTGSELVSEYLVPISRSPLLEGRIHEGVEAVSAGRASLLKGEEIGKPERDSFPFRVLWKNAAGEEGVTTSRFLIDATGVYRAPTATGSGGVPAPGERAAESRIVRHLPDVLGANRVRYEGRRILLVGAGYSAATVISALATLIEESERTRVHWALRGTREHPFHAIADDPLPERRSLTDRANAIATSSLDSLTLHRGVTIDRFTDTNDGLAVTLRSAECSSSEVAVDEVISLTGYRPDPTLLSELQVHLCWATDGLMKVSAHLMASSGASGDCLSLESGGAATLASPEPGLYVLGAKSYGRYSHYLMKTGIEQIGQVVAAISSQTSTASRESTLQKSTASETK